MAQPNCLPHTAADRGRVVFYELGIDEIVEPLFGLAFAAISAAMVAWTAAGYAADLIRRRNLDRELHQQTTQETAQT